jgi:hypothetical protein
MDLNPINYYNLIIAPTKIMYPPLILMTLEKVDISIYSKNAEACALVEF